MKIGNRASRLLPLAVVFACALSARSETAVPSDAKIARALTALISPGPDQDAFGHSDWDYLTAARFMASGPARDSVFAALKARKRWDPEYLVKISYFAAQEGFASPGDDRQILTYPLWEPHHPLSAAYFQMIRSAVKRDMLHLVEFQDRRFGKDQLRDRSLEDLILEQMLSEYRGMLRETLYFSKLARERKTHGATTDNVYSLLEARALRGSLRESLARMQYLKPGIDLHAEIAAAIETVKEVRALHAAAAVYNGKGADFVISDQYGNSLWRDMSWIRMLKHDLMEVEKNGRIFEKRKAVYGEHLADAVRGKPFAQPPGGIAPSDLVGRKFSLYLYKGLYQEKGNYFLEKPKSELLLGTIHILSRDKALLKHSDGGSPVESPWSLRSNLLVTNPEIMGNILFPLSAAPADLGGPIEVLVGTDRGPILIFLLEIE